MKTKNIKPGFMTICFAAISMIFLFDSCEVADDLLGGNETVTKIEGEWECNETSDIYKSTSSVYTVYISADPDNINGVIIDNFYDVGIDVKANVSGKTFIIPNQTAGDDFTVYGSGTISSNYGEITLNYSVDDGSGGQLDNVEAVYTKVD